MHGKGTFTWLDGRKYTGEYKDDKKDGYGLFEWADGRKYKGYWLDGRQNGEGMFYNVNQQKWRMGYWENGKRVRWIEEEKEKENEGVEN